MQNNSLQKDLTNDSEVHPIGEGNIQFGMNIDYNGVNLLSDSSYFTYTIKQVTQQYVLQGDQYVSQRTKTSLPVAYCTLDSFYQLSQDLYDRLTIKEYYWPTVKNYTIAANYNAPRYDYIEIKLYQWNPSTSKITWKSNITDVMKQTQFTLIISNNYLDFDNYVQPVQNYFDDRFFWDLAPGLRKKVDIFVRKNGANFIDDFIQLGQSTDDSFYQVSSMRESIVIEDTDLQIISVFFRLDSNYDNYSRRVYSFGDLMGQSGGLYSAVFMLGGVFISIFSERLFVSSILHKIYQIDEIRDNEVKKSIAESKGKNAVLPQIQVSDYGNNKILKKLKL